jgi:hypothetical protein
MQDSVRTELRTFRTAECTTVTVQLSVDIPLVVDHTLDAGALSLRVRELFTLGLEGALLTVVRSVQDAQKERG